MPAAPLIAPLPLITLDAGCTITVEAVSPTDGSAVSGVTVSAVALYAGNAVPGVYLAAGEDAFTFAPETGR